MRIFKRTAFVLLWTTAGLCIGFVFAHLLIGFLCSAVSPLGDFVPTRTNQLVLLAGAVSVGTVGALRCLLPSIAAKKWILALAVWFILLLCMYCYLLWPRPHIRVGVRFWERDILINNNEPFPLHDCVVRIGSGEQWELHLKSLPANGSVSLPLSGFNPVSSGNQNLRLSTRDSMVQAWIDPLVLICSEGRWRGCLMCT